MVIGKNKLTYLINIFAVKHLKILKLRNTVEEACSAAGESSVGTEKKGHLPTTARRSALL